MRTYRVLGLGMTISLLSLAGCAKHEQGLAMQPSPPTVGPAEVAAAVQALPEPDRTFVRQAAGANMAAIQIGQLALQRAYSDQVRSIANEMVDSHTRLNNDLRRAAMDQGVQLPIATMTPAQQDLYNRLSQLSGPAFDRAYLDGIRQVQTDTIGSFQNEAINGQVPELANFANNALPNLNARVRLVRRTMNQL